jgi:hypothetical protein
MKNLAAIFACFVLVGSSFAQSSKSSKTRARRNNPTVEKKDPLSYEEFLKATQPDAELPWQFGTSLGVTNDEANYVDLKKMFRTSQGTHKVWLKSFSLKHIEIKDHLLFCTLRVWEINCGERTMRLVSFVQYAPDGKVLDSEFSQGDKWQDVVPESTGEAIFDAVCKKR